jgi:hypothetical protein
MQIIDDIISSLDMKAGVRDIRQGLFHTAVLTRYCGLAATLPRDALQQEQPSVTQAGQLLQKGTSELVRMAYSKGILEAAIGMAAVNSLLEVKDGECVELNAAEVLAAKGRDKRIAIVGHFPFIPQLREIARELWVIEKNPRQGDFFEAEAEKLVPRADVVGITGSAFTNHTIEQLLGLCSLKAYLVVLGDTAPLSSVLFDYGVDAVSGTKVVDTDLVLRCVSEGATYRQIKGIQQLTMLASKGKTH